MSGRNKGSLPPEQDALRDTQGGTFDRLDRKGGRQGDQVKEQVPTRTHILERTLEAHRFRLTRICYRQAWSIAKAR